MTSQISQDYYKVNKSPVKKRDLSQEVSVQIEMPKKQPFRQLKKPVFHSKKSSVISTITKEY